MPPERLELLLGRFEMCSTRAVLAEEFYGVAEMVPGLVILSGNSIEATETKSRDGEARSDRQGPEVMQLGVGDVVQGLVGCAEGEVHMVDLVGEWVEFE